MARAWRIAAWSLGGLLLLVLLTVATVIIIGNTAAGRGLLESETAKLTSGRVRIAGLGGAFPDDLEIASLQLRDGKGVWLTAERVALHWSPWALIAWHLHIESLGIGRAAVVRRPVSTSAPSRRSSRSFPLPAIDIDRVVVDALVLEPAAAGMSARLDIRGDLHYRSMSHAHARLVARRTNGTGDYELALRLSRSRMSASLKLDEPAGGPLEHLVDLPDLGALSVLASLEGARAAERLRLVAHAGQLSARADGTLDLLRRAADLTYSVSSPAISPQPGLAWRRVTLRGHWLGPVSAPQATGVLDLKGLELSDGAQLGSLQANLAANGRVLTLSASAGGIVLTGSQPQLLQGSPLDLNATLNLEAPGRPLQLTLTHRLLEAHVEAITAGSRSATFDLRLRDLGALAAHYHEDIHGTMSLSGKLAERGRATTLDVSGTGALTGASLAARLLGADARVHLSGNITPAAVDLDTLELTGRALLVRAYGTAERSGPGASSGPLQSLHAHWQVSLPRLALIWPSAAGSLDTTGTADGPMQSLTADVQVRSKLAVAGSPPGTIEAGLKARGLPSAPSASLQANGSFDGAPLRLSASVERAAAANTFHLIIPRATWKSLAIHGNLTAGRDLATARGSLRLRLAHLADLQSLIGRPLQGGITASVDLTPAAGGAHTSFALIASHVVAGGLSGDARLSALGPLDALRIALSAQSRLRGSPADLSVSARLNELKRVLELERVELRYHGQTAHLISPARVMLASGIRVRNLRIGAQKAVLALDGQLSPTLDFRASIHHLEVGLVDAVAPDLLAAGELNADAQLRGRSTAPVGSASFELTGLKLANSAALGLPAVNLHGSARFRRRTARVFAELAAGRKSRLTLSGRAPLSSTGTVALRVAGTMDAALMNSILEARGEQAAGTLTVDASVSGTTHAPQIRGVVRLANGDLRDYAEGVHLDHINARLVGSQGVLRIASLTARAGPGRLSARGTVGVLQPGMPIHIFLSAHKIQPITNDILTANLDADMRVAGTLRRRMDITGTLHVNHASINVPNGLPPSVATLNVIRPGQKAQPPAAAGPGLVIGLRITLDAPAAIFVQGRGLDTQLGGELKVTGTSDKPQVSGGFSMIRGTFSLAGTSLNFTSGRVSFNGQGLKDKIDPTLDFIAQSTVTYNGPTTVTLHVTGFADSPKISLSSNPPLPQDDLLALLLFGKPASKLSAIEVAETGAALASLSGIGPGGGGGSKWNPLTWIQKGLGLNTLSVGSASPPGGAAAGGGTSATGASIMAGKYISNRVYVGATQSTNGTSQVQVDIDLSQYLKLLTRLGNGTSTAQGTTPENDPGSSIGIAWQMPY
ncbi:MAG: translocation/assembly module TamB domain-containing protein [Steroidobacteraceae bacterium]